MREAFHGLRLSLGPILLLLLCPLTSWAKSYSSFHLHEQHIQPLPSPKGATPNYGMAFTPLPHKHWDVAVDDMRANVIYLMDTTASPPRSFPIRLGGNICPQEEPHWTMATGGELAMDVLSVQDYIMTSA